LLMCEVVCTKNYLDVGLAVGIDCQRKPTHVRAPATKLNPYGYYGGVRTLDWIRTGVYMTSDEWTKLTYGKHTTPILQELGIPKK